MKRLDEPTRADEERSDSGRREHRSRFSEERRLLEIQRAELKEAERRTRRNSLILQVVTMAAFGALVTLTLGDTYIQIANQNIGLLDWLRSSNPISLTATIGSAAVALVGAVAALYSSLRTAELNYRRRIRAYEPSMHRGSTEPEPTSTQEPIDQSSQPAQAVNELTDEDLYELVDRVSTEFASRFPQADCLRQIRSIYESAQARLSAEINALNSRSLLNLTIGSLVTVVAAMVLVYIAVSDPPRLTTQNFEPSTWLDLASHYLPRLSIVIFLEVFAFFFLRLYRNGLIEIRLYQTDLSKLSTQAAAVELVFSSSSESDRASAAQAMINAEWNNSVVDSASSPSGIDAKLIGELANLAAKMASRSS